MPRHGDVRCNLIAKSARNRANVPFTHDPGRPLGHRHSGAPAGGRSDADPHDPCPGPATPAPNMRHAAGPETWPCRKSRGSGAGFWRIMPQGQTGLLLGVFRRKPMAGPGVGRAGHAVPPARPSCPYPMPARSGPRPNGSRIRRSLPARPDGTSGRDRQAHPPLHGAMRCPPGLGSRSGNANGTRAVDDPAAHCGAGHVRSPCARADCRQSRPPATFSGPSVDEDKCPRKGRGPRPSLHHMGSCGNRDHEGKPLLRPGMSQRTDNA